MSVNIIVFVEGNGKSVSSRFVFRHTGCVRSIDRDLKPLYDVHIL